MIIYVKLLNEGTVVFRPAEAQQIKDKEYMLDLPQNYDALDEEWEFKPGTTVRCEKQTFEGEESLVAVAQI